MSREHNDHGKPACKSCGNLFNAQKDLRVHITRTYKNDEDEEGNKIFTSMVSNCTDDNMKITTKDNVDGEANRDTAIKIEPLMSSCEDSSKCYQTSR